MKYSKKHLNILYGSVSDGICVLAGRKVFWHNRSFAEYFGSALKRINGISIKSVLQDNLLKKIEYCRNTERKQTLKNTFLLKKCSFKLTCRISNLDITENLILLVFQQNDESTITNSVIDKSLYICESVFMSARESILITDLNGSIKNVNPSFLQVFGFHQDEVKNKNFSDISGKKWFLEEKKYNELIVKEGKTHSENCEFKRKSGEVFNSEISVWMIPANDAGGELLCIFIYNVSDSYLRGLEKHELRAKRRELEYIVNTSPSVAFLWRAEKDWPVDFVSENVAIFGYQPGDFYEQKVQFADIVHPDDLLRVTEEVSYYSRYNFKTFKQEYRIRTKTGTYRWIDDRTFIRRDINGKITHYQGTVLDITDRKDAEEALRENERQFRKLIEKLPAMVCSYDDEGRITFWNNECERLLGYKADEVLQNPDMLNLLFPDEEYRKDIRHNYIESRTGFYNWITEMTTKNGNKKMVSWSNISNIVHIKEWKNWAIGLDLTDRISAENAIKTLMEGSPAVIEGSYNDNTVKHLNDWLDTDCTLIAEKTGTKKYKIVSMRMGKGFIHDLFAETEKSAFEYIIENGMLLHKSGILFHFPEDSLLAESHAEGFIGIPLMDRDGNHFGALMAFSRKTLKLPLNSKDIFKITAAKISAEIERKRFSDALIAEQDKLKGLLQYQSLLAETASILNSSDSLLDGLSKAVFTINCGIGDFDIFLNFFDSKELYLLLSGLVNIDYDKIEYINKDILPKWILDRLETGRTVYYSEENVQEDYHKEYFRQQNISSIIMIPIRVMNFTAGFISFVGNGSKVWRKEIKDFARTFVEFITNTLERYFHFSARLEAEKEQTKAARLAERSSRLASLGTLAAGISHEINQPLNAIKIASDGMLYFKDSNLPITEENIFTNIKSISEQAEKIDSIITHMRNLAIQDRDIPFIELDMSVLVSQSLKLIKQQLKSHQISIVFNIEKNIPLVRGHSVQMEQVMINLVVNAMQALNKTGQANKKIDIHVFRNNNNCMIEISDNGPGIPEDRLMHIFDPFYTSKRNEKGMGLGLSICDTIIRSLDGSISARNKEEGGIVFTIMLPGIIGGTKEEE